MKIFRLFVAFTVVCFAFSSQMQAVVPPPDGGYPNFTTAEGQNALHSLTAGAANTGLGAYSLFRTSTGSFNTAVGAGALDLNTGDQNTAVGVAALLLNTTGVNNTASGVAALEFNDAGSNNTAYGAFALFSNTTGNFNTAIGSGALTSNTAGANTATGALALYVNTTGDSNTADGALALQHNTASGNTATGFGALNGNTTGFENTADGASALFTNTTGVANTANGETALSSNTTGNANTAVGRAALSSNTTGGQNTASGLGALSSNTSGSTNTALGFQAGTNVVMASNVICIGANVAGADVSDSCFIGSIFGQTSSGGVGVFINNNGRLGTMTSSRRFKEDIQPMDKNSESLFALKPVTFRYKKEIDPAGTSQLGLVAEDVEKINPDLVVRDKEGKPYSVRYDQVNAMLLNEFLKEHKKVHEQEATIAQLKKELQATASHQQKQIDALTACLQKVSAHLELNKPASRTVLNDR